MGSHEGASYLQELVDLHLAVLVQVHLIQDLMQGVFINVNIDVLKRDGEKP